MSTQRAKNERKMLAHNPALPTLMLFSLAILSSTASSVPIDQENIASTGTNAIKVTLLVDKHTFAVGVPINVKVNIFNQSSEPVVVANDISIASGSDANVKFELTDTAGQVSPTVSMIADSFATTQSTVNSWNSVLGRWLVLYPGYSICASFSLDGKLFSFLNKPGKYKVQATYSSGGLSYPPNYRRLGLKENDLGSMPYRGFSGTVRTNTVWVTVITKTRTKTAKSSSEMQK